MHLVSTFENDLISGNIYYDKLKYTIKGKLANWDVHSLKYNAAAPGDLRLSYSGSLLPFATADQAYDTSPNTGEVTVNDGNFEFVVMSPNSYYVNNGVDLVEPHVNLILEGDKKMSLKLGHHFPNRSLKHLIGRPNRSYDR